MKPNRFSEAHRSEYLAELVCSNSLKSQNPANPQGLLKEEMRRMGSLIIESGDKHSIPSGEALSVDRLSFSKYITERIESAGNVRVVREEITGVGDISDLY